MVASFPGKFKPAASNRLVFCARSVYNDGMLWKMIKNVIPIMLAVLLLAACGKSGADGAPGGPAAPALWQPEALPAIPGEESAPPAEPDGPTDGLEGSYYNDFLRETLILDGRGGFSVCWPGGVMGGGYSRSDSGDLILRISEEVRMTARFDGGGDLGVDGRQGRYLRDWDFWGITTAEAGIHPVNTLPDTEEIALGGGLYRYRDFPAGLALTYDETLQIAAGRIPGAVCVADGKGGYVVGRSVTRRFDGSGSAEDFLDAYIRDSVFTDAETLYGAVGGYDGLRILSGKTKGRLAAGEAALDCEGRQIAARVLLYTSAFADGTTEYICKCVFAPAGETAQLDALAAGVADMGAARLVQLS